MSCDPKASSQNTNNKQKPLDISTYTQGCLEGSGDFDVMARAFEEHIKSQYDAERIDGEDYATAYIQGIIQISQNALQFSLNKRKTDIEIEILEQEKLKSAQEVINMQKQNTKTEQEIALIVQQTSNANSQYETLCLQRTQISENIETSKVVRNKTIKEIDLLECSKLKIEEEIALLKMKTETERAQTYSSRPNGEKISGILGAQKSLYEEQKSSFVKDATIKGTKVLTDMFAVLRGTDEELAPPSSLGSASINEMVNRMKATV